LAFVLKLILLFALWALFFSPAHRPHVVPEAVGAQLLPLT
jgi:hypothetical protein